MLTCLTTLSAQRQRSKTVLHKVNNKEIVQKVYPAAFKVEKANEYWFKILDDKGKVIGFAMSSNSFCKNIIGYSSTTPVLIITDLKFVIKKVALLSHQETLGYVYKLEKNGFFDLWNDKILKAAKKVRIDGYSGATCTAKAVEKNVDFLLNNGTQKLPKK